MALKSVERRVDELELNKQDTLVSGVTIKTINGNSVLGSGNLVISTASTITVGTTPVTSGIDGRVFFQSGGVVQQDSGLFWDNTNKRLGIGTNTPSNTFVVRSPNASGIELINSSNSKSWRISPNSNDLYIVESGVGNSLIIKSGGNIGIGTTSPQSRLDVRAQGALSTDIAFRVRNSADTFDIIRAKGDGTVSIGIGAGNVNTGSNNNFFGGNAGRDTTTATNNNFFGFQAGRFNTTGNNNSFFGASAGRDNTIGGQNSFFGLTAGLSNTTGSENTALGVNSGANNTTGNNNSFFGNSAGRFIADNTTANSISNNSVFLGASTKANANNQTNQIVIGFDAIGTGSNSVTLGNTSITRTNLRGQIVISGFASAPTGVEGAIYYDSTTKKHYGFDGTNWNALY